ncbi:hypothetical protein F383_01937 [Gossypium arboreum]|uniref:Uncharacterized protein n=1 Tax=Gossypium arboreum TaxID=29729 RepID=A0A0B0NYN1_GOSAR|nr:hypothetical protein F383_01937 [Gossypium arboreum]
MTMAISHLYHIHAIIIINSSRKSIAYACIFKMGLQPHNKNKPIHFGKIISHTRIFKLLYMPQTQST